MNVQKWIVTALFVLAAVFSGAGVALADMNTDFRVKLGTAAGADTFELADAALTGNVSGDSGGNFQLEVVLSRQFESGPSLVVGGGLFSRTHKGNMNDLFFPPMAIEYDAAGLSGTVGIGAKANDNFHFEGRLELDLGAGEPTLASPGIIWNSVQTGPYSAVSLIVGGYYTVGKPGFQIGLELGAQSFAGDFQIWNNFGFWENGTVKGSGGTISLVGGCRF